MSIFKTTGAYSLSSQQKKTNISSPHNKPEL